jgi:alkaline phosphatase D
VDFTAAAQPAAAPVAAAAGWTGEWTSNFGVMSVREDAGRLFGTYTHDSGQFEGKLEAGKLVGTWKEAPSAKDPAGSKDDGSFELTLAKDGQSFSGTFRYTASAKVDGKWSGKRKK